MKNRIMALVFLSMLFMTAGCIPKSAEEAQVDFCQALLVYGDSLQTLKNTNASTTVDEIQIARETVSKTREDVKSAAGDLREAKIRSAEKAWENLQDIINDIPGDATLGQAAATIRGGALLLSTEIERIRNISCGRR